MGDTTFEKPKEKRGYVQEIPVSNIVRPEDDIRLDRWENEEFAKNIHKDIRDNGLLEPIIVRPRGENTFEVVAGTYRLLVFKDLGMETIPARIIDCDDKEAIIIGLRENLHRDSMRPYELIHNVRKLQDEFDMNLSTIADELGYDVQYIYTLNSVYKKIDMENLKRWKEGKIKYSTAKNIAYDSEEEKSNAKEDFFTGESIYDYETIRVSKETKGELEALKEDISKIIRLNTQQDINLVCYDGENNINNILESEFGKYGKTIVDVLHYLLIKNLRFREE